MKTIRNWIDELPYEIMGKAYNYQGENWSTEVGDLGTAIKAAFPWDTTIEGEEYWYSVSRRNFDDHGTVGMASSKEPTKSLTSERGKNYGHPKHQFCCVEDMYDSWCERRAGANRDKIIDYDIEHPLRHAVYMILTKLSRAAENPLHMDNWDDIQGYAECFKMCVNKDKENRND